MPPTMMPMVPQRYGHGTADCTGRRSQHVKRAVMASVGGLKKALSRCYTRLAEGSWRLCHGGGFGSDRKRLPNFASVSRRALARGRAITRRDRQSTREPIRFDRSYGERYLLEEAENYSRWRLAGACNFSDQQAFCKMSVGGSLRNLPVVGRLQTSIYHTITGTCYATAAPTHPRDFCSPSPHGLPCSAAWRIRTADAPAVLRDNRSSRQQGHHRYMLHD